MVKGITRQVILVQSPDQKLFEQAIFIVKENAADVTDEMLLKEAQSALSRPGKEKRRGHIGPLWACAGALATGIIWLLTVIL